MGRFSDMKNNNSVFKRRRQTFTVVFGSVFALFLFASIITQYNPADGLLSVPRALSWMAANLIPNQDSMERFPKILNKLVETSLLSVSVTVTAAALAFF